MTDPYEILGVRRGDSDDAIRAAYRRMAKRYHPDLNPGKPEALERFKAINAAYDLLSDPEKHARFDRGEIDADGRERATRRPPPGGPHPRYAGRGQPSADDLDDLFTSAFGSRAGGPGFAPGGSDAHYSLTVSFLEAALGTVRRLTLPDGRVLDVTIPAGLRDGHVLRLKRQGQRGMAGGLPGDALVEVNVAPHPLFRRVGDDVVMELPMTLREAVLGTTLEVPTVQGKVRMTIPPWSAPGTRLRLAGRGITGGNQVVELKLALPTQPEPALAAFLESWQPQHPFDPRAGLDTEAG
jgi:DnaJ-class molecular chaperone